MEKPKYTYAPRGCQWAVLKWEYLPNGSKGTVFKYFQEKEPAKMFAKMLNTKPPTPSN